MEKTSLTGEDVAEGVDEILMNADNALCEEVHTEFSVSVSVLIYTFFYTMSAFQCAFSLFWARAQTPGLLQRDFTQCHCLGKKKAHNYWMENIPHFFPHL